MNRSAVDISIQVFKYPFSVLLNAVVLLSHMLCAFSFLRSYQTVSPALASVYLPIKNVPGYQFLHIFDDTYYCFIYF